MAEREIIETKFSGLRKRGCSSNNSDGDNETNHPVPFLEAFTMLQPLTTPRCCDSFFILRITTIYFNRMNRISRARRRLKKYHTQTHTHTHGYKTKYIYLGDSIDGKRTKNWLKLAKSSMQMWRLCFLFQSISELYCFCHRMACVPEK